MASNYSLNPNNNSLFYGSTFKEFHIGLNLSEYYTFMQDEIVLYYFDAELTDGNHSLLYDINYENNNNTWCFLFIRHLPSEGGGSRDPVGAHSRLFPLMPLWSVMYHTTKI